MFVSCHNWDQNGFYPRFQSHLRWVSHPLKSSNKFSRVLRSNPTILLLCLIDQKQFVALTLESSLVRRHEILVPTGLQLGWNGNVTSLDWKMVYGIVESIIKKQQAIWKSSTVLKRTPAANRRSKDFRRFLYNSVAHSKRFGLRPRTPFLLEWVFSLWMRC